MADAEDLKSSTTFVDLRFKTDAATFNIIPIKTERSLVLVGPRAGNPQNGNNAANERHINTVERWDSDDDMIDELVGPTGLHLVAEIADVVHGTMSPGGDPATLIVMKFKFLPHGGRRFKSADITVSFPDTEGSQTLAVEQVAPDGLYTLDPSVIVEGETWEVGVTSITIPPGITINFTPFFKHTKAGEKTNYATVSGIATIDDSRRLKQKHGKRNAVQWSLHENADTGHGMPTWLQGAILLKRDASLDKALATFKMLVDIKVDIDGRPWSRSITFKTPEDDAQILDPAQPSLGKDWKVDSLRDENLEELQKMIMFTPVSQPVSPMKEIKLLVN